MMNNYGTPPLALVSGRGVRVTDVDGASTSTSSLASRSPRSVMPIRR